MNYSFDMDGIKSMKLCDYIEITDTSDDVHIYNLFLSKEYGLCLSIENKPLIKFLHINNSQVEEYYVNGGIGIEHKQIRTIKIDSHWSEKKFQKGFMVEGYLLQYNYEMGMKYNLHPEEYYDKSPNNYEQIAAIRKMRKRKKENN